MRSQLLSFTLLISTVSAQVEDGQLIPGLDRPVPDPTLDACFKETALLFDNQAVRNEISRLDGQYIGRPYADFCSLSEDGVYVCQVDWSKFDNNLSQICGAAGGAYQESAHDITCRASAANANDSVNGGFLFQHSNLPDCFGKDCKKADIERLLATTVINMEREYETSLNLPCSSDYDIEDPTLDQEREQGMADDSTSKKAGTTLWSLTSLLTALLLLRLT